VGTYLASLLLLTPAEVMTANDAGAAMIDPLAGLLAIVAAAVVRMALSWLAKIFRLGTGEIGRGQGVMTLLLTGTVAGMGFLPPCLTDFDSNAKAQGTPRGAEVYPGE
jgi:hypothetical protein